MGNFMSNLAPTYSTSTSYTVGDHVIYSGNLYTCIADTTGTWTAANWEATYLSDIIGGGSGGDIDPSDLEPVLLWTNSSPTSSFAAQTISLNLSDYAGIIIELNDAINVQEIYSRGYIKVGDSNTNVACGIKHGNSDLVRIVTATSSGVTISDAYNNGSAANGYAIPARIYGVKKVLVEVESEYPSIIGCGFTNSATEKEFTNIYHDTSLFEKTSNGYVAKKNMTVNVSCGVGYVSGSTGACITVYLNNTSKLSTWNKYTEYTVALTLAKNDVLKITFRAENANNTINGFVRVTATPT